MFSTRITNMWRCLVNQAASSQELCRATRWRKPGQSRKAKHDVEPTAIRQSEASSGDVRRACDRTFARGRHGPRKGVEQRRSSSHQRHRRHRGDAFGTEAMYLVRAQEGGPAHERRCGWATRRVVGERFRTPYSLAPSFRTQPPVGERANTIGVLLTCERKHSDRMFGRPPQVHRIYTLSSDTARRRGNYSKRLLVCRCVHVFGNGRHSQINSCQL